MTSSAASWRHGNSQLIRPSLYPVAWFTALLAAGVLVVEVLGLSPAPRSGDSWLALGRVLVHYVVAGAQALFFGILGLTCLIAVLVGLPLTIFDYLRRLVRATVNGIRFVRDNGVDHTFALSLPLSLVIPAFAAFVYVTGLKSYAFWLLALPPAGIAAGYCFRAWKRLYPRLGRVGGAIVVGTAVTVVGVRVFENLHQSLPSELPPLTPGWGPYLASVAGLVVIVGSWRTGGHSKVRLMAPEAVPNTPVTVPLPPPAPRPRRTVRYPRLESEDHWSPTPVEGWRAWMWTGNALRGYWAEWSTSTMDAECGTCDEVPGECGCGVYAVKSRALVSSAFLTANGARDVIVGRVEMEGLVIEHELGYRAERAQIVELWVPRHLRGAIAARYPDVELRTERRSDG